LIFYVFSRRFREDIGSLLKGQTQEMADIDALNAAVAQIDTDEAAEEALGVSFQAAIGLLQQEVAAGSPNLQPAIAALTRARCEDQGGHGSGRNASRLAHAALG
jgi:hypothetical protein